MSPAFGQEVAATVAKHAVSAASNPLDGLQFAVDIMKDGAPAAPNGSLEDRLKFDHGKFSSDICTRFNFAAAPYWTRMDGGEVRFLAELTSPTDGKMVWEGTISDGKLDGTMHWTRSRWYWTIDADHHIQGELISSPSD